MCVCIYECIYECIYTHTFQLFKTCSFLILFLIISKAGYTAALTLYESEGWWHLHIAETGLKYRFFFVSQIGKMTSFWDTGEMKGGKFLHSVPPAGCEAVRCPCGVWLRCGPVHSCCPRSTQPYPLSGHSSYPDLPPGWDAHPWTEGNTSLWGLAGLSANHQHPSQLYNSGQVGVSPSLHLLPTKLE